MRQVLLGIMLFCCIGIAGAQETRYQQVNRELTGDWQLVEMEVKDLRLPVDSNVVSAAFNFKPGHSFVASTPMGNYDGFWDVNATADSVVVIETENERETTAYKIDYLSPERLTLTYLLETEVYTFYFRRRL